MTDKFVIVAEYMDSIKADLAKQVLDDFGIQAIIVGQNVGDGRIGVFETVKLQVKESDVGQAKEILEEQEQGYEPEEYEIMDETDEADEPYDPQKEEQ